MKIRSLHTLANETDIELIDETIDEIVGVLTDNEVENLDEDARADIIDLLTDLVSNQEKRIKARIVATAGNLSRAVGRVSDVLENHKDYEKNLRLAKNIIGYGHKTISEHDYVVLSLEDVTPIVEQTLIGYRLTSFTIKSRRNVDFRNVGFYIPDFKDKNNNILPNNKELQKEYITYINSLFNKYGELVDENLPIEDCRYIIPYCYNSNIIMGCDANEFLRITSDLLYGNLSNLPELRELGENFKRIMQEEHPYLISSLEQEEGKEYYKDHLAQFDETINKCASKSKIYDPNQIEKLAGTGAVLTKYTHNADLEIIYSILMARYQITREEAMTILIKLSYDHPNIREEILDAVFKNKNQRELEQSIVSFYSTISLAVLTHLTRHRMHSLLVPDFVTPKLWNINNYVTPPTIAQNHLAEYDAVFKKNAEMVEYFKSQGVRDEDLIYFYLSGNTANVTTTMNIRQLKWISRMRCCNKAQWEIRNIAKSMVAQVTELYPLLKPHLGPYCETEGYCPEGKDSCKNRGVVRKIDLVKKEGSKK